MGPSVQNTAVLASASLIPYCLLPQVVAAPAGTRGSQARAGSRSGVTDLGSASGARQLGPALAVLVGGPRQRRVQRIDGRGEPAQHGADRKSLLDTEVIEHISSNAAKVMRVSTPKPCQTALCERRQHAATV